MEANSLSLTKMIRKQWRVLWELVEIVKNICHIMQQTGAHIVHTFRGRNMVADQLANVTIENQQLQEYNSYSPLTGKTKGLINIDNAQIPSIRIKSRAIKINKNQQHA